MLDRIDKRTLLPLALVLALTTQACVQAEPPIVKSTPTKQPTPTRSIRERTPTPIEVDPFLDPAIPRYARNGSLLPVGHSQVVGRSFEPEVIRESKAVRPDPRDETLPPNYRRTHPGRVIEERRSVKIPARYVVMSESCIDTAALAGRLAMECRTESYSVPEAVYQSLKEGQVINRSFLSPHPRSAPTTSSIVVRS